MAAFDFGALTHGKFNNKFFEELEKFSASY